MKTTGMYADFKVTAEVVPTSTIDDPNNVWVDVSIAHAVTREVIYAQIEPYIRVGSGVCSNSNALNSAAARARAYIDGLS